MGQCGTLSFGVVDPLSSKFDRRLGALQSADSNPLARCLRKGMGWDASGGIAQGVGRASKGPFSSISEQCR